MDNFSLFDDPKPTLLIPNIEGVTYISDFLNEDDEKNIIEHIDRQQWITDLERRVQHYGFRYDYKKTSLDQNINVPKIPVWLNPMIRELVEECELIQPPNQLIVNEYQPGQGISEHIDATEIFGDTIIMISLGSSCIMDFTLEENKTKRKESIFLERRSLLMIQKEARYKWKHSISKRKNDVWDNFPYKRDRRISLTFRNVA